MDEKLVKEYLENLEKTNKHRVDNDKTYNELCEKYKDYKNDALQVDSSHSLDDYFNKYSKQLESGKLLAFKENELWLMDPKKKYWKINNNSDFKYFELPSSKFSFLSAVTPYLTLRNGVIALATTTLVFASLFIWKAVTSGGGSGGSDGNFKLNINCENCNYTVLGGKTSFGPHEVAYITFNETDSDMYKLTDEYNSNCFNVEGDVEDGRRYYGENHVLAVEFNEKDITIDASAFPTFTTFKLEEKSSYDPLKFIYVADKDDNIYVDWGDGVKKTRSRHRFY